MTATLEPDLDAWMQRIQKLPEPERSAMMKWARTELVRFRSLRANRNPAELAASVVDDYVRTPAIDLLGEELERAICTRRGRLLITMPPQEGKTELTAVWTVIRVLQKDPNHRIILASYSQDLAEQASMRARSILAAHGASARDPLTGLTSEDKIGIGLAAEKAAASHWRIKGHKGGLVATGLGGTITGRPADLVIIDDPLKGMQAADSAAERRKIIEGFQGDVTTRLAPGAPIILIQTRWHEKDLAGWILEQEALLPPEQRRWRHVNIPALAMEGVDDALGRESGTWLESSRGRTEADWEETRRAVGERVFFALYQGSPTPTGGGLFSKDDFQRYRVPQLPDNTIVRLVSIDPAETGYGDEAAVIGAAASNDGRIYWTHDWSGLMQSDQWARKGVLLALTIGAGEVSYEAYTTEQTYGRVIKHAWSQIRDQARLIRAHKGDLEAAALQLAASEDAPADPYAQLQELVDVPVPDTEDPPFRIRGYRGKGDKVARATGARQAHATGRLRIVGTLPALEHQAATWQMGQDSPDRMDAAVNAFNRLAELTGAASVIVTPQQAAQQQEGQAPSAIGSILGRSLNASDRA